MLWSLLITAVCIAVIYLVLDKVLRAIKVDSLSSKHVLITGCDTGFGHFLALHLDKLGVNVFAGCFSEDGMSKLREKASSRLLPLCLDVTKTDSIEKAVEFVKNNLPEGTGLWSIVNNAGIVGVLGPVEICTQEDFHKTLAVNLLGPIEMSRQFLPLVRKAKGRIVNMASAMGRIVGEAPPYAISKFGMEAFSDALRRDLYNMGVKVSIIEPGFFRTNVVAKDTMNNALLNAFAAVDVEVKEAYGGDTYIKNVCGCFLAQEDWHLRI